MSPEAKKEIVYDSEIRDEDTQNGVMRLVDGREVSSKMVKVVCEHIGETAVELSVKTVAHITAVETRGKDVLPSTDDVCRENASKIPGYHRIVWVGDSGQPPHETQYWNKKPRIDYNPPV